MKIEKKQRVSSLRSLLQDGQLLWQLNGIRSMVTLENMRCCTLTVGVHGTRYRAALIGIEWKRFAA